MAPQQYSWTCSVASFTWVINSTGVDPNLTRDQALQLIGYPNCVNETYGLMSSDCLVAAYNYYGLDARVEWVTYDQAYSIMSGHTGQINPLGMYHFMAIRGVDGYNPGDLWVANSAQGYMGVWDSLNRSQFNALGPVKIIYLV
ncbi:MAG TPA: hypothetical protein VH593_29210 [Ktedonobacteraceae bacterium]|jgi:hypothetical protein